MAGCASGESHPPSSVSDESAAPYSPITDRGDRGDESHGSPMAPRGTRSPNGAATRTATGRRGKRRMWGGGGGCVAGAHAHRYPPKRRDKGRARDATGREPRRWRAAPAHAPNLGVVVSSRRPLGEAAQKRRRPRSAPERHASAAAPKQVTPWPRLAPTCPRRNRHAPPAAPPVAVAAFCGPSSTRGRRRGLGAARRCRHNLHDRTRESKHAHSKAQCDGQCDQASGALQSV